MGRTVTYKTTFLLRRGLAATLKEKNIQLLAGEPAFEIDTGKLKIGDGVHDYLTLPYINQKELIALRDELLGSDKPGEGETTKTIRQIAKEEIEAQLITDDAKEALDTLEEIAAWIQDHPDEASNLSLAIQRIQNTIGVHSAPAEEEVFSAIIHGPMYPADSDTPLENHLEIEPNVTYYQDAEHTILLREGIDYIVGSPAVPAVEATGMMRMIEDLEEDVEILKNATPDNSELEALKEQVGEPATPEIQEREGQILTGDATLYTQPQFSYAIFDSDLVEGATYYTYDDSIGGFRLAVDGVDYISPLSHKEAYEGTGLEKRVAKLETEVGESTVGNKTKIINGDTLDNGLKALYYQYDTPAHRGAIPYTIDELEFEFWYKNHISNVKIYKDYNCTEEAILGVDYIIASDDYAEGSGILKDIEDIQDTLGNKTIVIHYGPRIINGSMNTNNEIVLYYDNGYGDACEESNPQEGFVYYKDYYFTDVAIEGIDYFVDYTETIEASGLGKDVEDLEIFVGKFTSSEQKVTSAVINVDELWVKLNDDANNSYKVNTIIMKLLPADTVYYLDKDRTTIAEEGVDYILETVPKVEASGICKKIEDLESTLLNFIAITNEEIDEMFESDNT